MTDKNIQATHIAKDGLRKLSRREMTGLSGGSKVLGQCIYMEYNAGWEGQKGMTHQQKYDAAVATCQAILA